VAYRESSSIYTSGDSSISTSDEESDASPYKRKALSSHADTTFRTLKKGAHKIEGGNVNIDL